MTLHAVTSFIVFPLLAGAMALSFLRLLRGPTLADRIVAFDLIAAASAGVIIVTAIDSEQPVLVDVASIWAIIAFLGVIAFAWYSELRGGI